MVSGKGSLSTNCGSTFTRRLLYRCPGCCRRPASGPCLLHRALASTTTAVVDDGIVPHLRLGRSSERARTVLEELRTFSEKLSVEPACIYPLPSQKPQHLLGACAELYLVPNLPDKVSMNRNYGGYSSTPVLRNCPDVLRFASKDRKIWGLYTDQRAASNGRTSVTLLART